MQASQVRSPIADAERQAEELKKLAAEEGVSVAELVRKSVDLYLGSKGSGERRTRLDRAKNIAGRFRSGLGDLAENHDKYLWESDRP